MEDIYAKVDATEIEIFVFSKCSPSVQHRMVSETLLTRVTAEDGYGGSIGGRRRALRGGSGGAGSSKGSHSSSMVE